MFNYFLKRLLSIIPLAFGIVTLSFFIIHLTPGKPVTLEQSLNPRVSPEIRQRLEKLYGLDKPLHAQYLQWLFKVARFDFGYSFTDERPVIKKILERLPVTLTINFASLLIVLFLAIPIGVRCAVKEGMFLDKFMAIYAFLGFALPTFWIALLCIDFFCIRLGWLPVSGIKSLDFAYYSFFGKAIDLAKHLALPILVSTISGFAALSRYMRSSMSEILTQPYIRAARARGLPDNAIFYRHALKNALLPIVTIIGLSIPGLIGGSVIFESIFAIPGAGRLFFEAVMMRDYPLIMAEIVITAMLTLAGNLMADISYAFIDPRIRYQKS